MPILQPLVDFDAVFDFRDFQKATLWTTFFVHNINLELPGGRTKTVLAATLLFLTIVITVPLGPTGFKRPFVGWRANYLFCLCLFVPFVV